MTQTGGLHLKYRPQSLSEVVGNEFLIDSVQAFLKRKPEDRPRAYLLAGPSGCGKTTIARIMAAEFGAVGMDLMEIDVADYRGIDTIRDLRKRIQLQPMESPVRAYILDEAHMLTKEAQTALLKSLEDTPSHVVFFICTTDPTKLLLTVRNRCTQMTVGRLEDGDMEDHLEYVITSEGKKVSRGAREKLIEQAQGSPRLLLTMLDRIIDLPRGEQADAVQMVGENTTEIIDLCRLLIKGRGNWRKIVQGLMQKAEPEDVRRAVLGYCTTAMLGGDKGQSYILMRAFEEPTYNTGWAGVVMACYDAQEGE